MEITSENLAAEIKRELLAKPKAKPAAQECFSCGRSYGAHGDGGFCSPRCREWFDAGNPPCDRSYVRSVTDMPLKAWKVAAGAVIGSSPWQSVIDASERGEQQKDLIRPRKLCDRCGARIPPWIKGRAVNSNRTRCFACSPEKARR
jgi:hypothetical protein